MSNNKHVSRLTINIPNGGPSSFVTATSIIANTTVNIMKFFITFNSFHYRVCNRCEKESLSFPYAIILQIIPNASNHNPIASNILPPIITALAIANLLAILLIIYSSNNFISIIGVVKTATYVKVAKKKA